jgi:hypothetical protein
VQIFGKVEYQSELRFDLPQQQHEQSGLSYLDKQQITQILIQYGLPTTGDGKNDYHTLKSKMLGSA